MDRPYELVDVMPAGHFMLYVHDKELDQATLEALRACRNVLLVSEELVMVGVRHHTIHVCREAIDVGVSPLDVRRQTEHEVLQTLAGYYGF